MKESTNPKPKNFIWEKLKEFEKIGMDEQKKQKLREANPPISPQLLLKHKTMDIGNIDFKYILVYCNVFEISCAEMAKEIPYAEYAEVAKEI